LIRKLLCSFMSKLNSTDYTVLFELIRNSKISDRKLASKLGVSQPTITRRRARLESKGLIDYMVVPNFEKFGIEIIAFTFASWKPETRREYKKKQDSKEMIKRHDRFLSSHANIIFEAGGRGFGNGAGGVFMSLHRNYTEYSDFLKDLEIAWGEYITRINSFVVSTRSGQIRRHFTFKYLKDYIK